VRVVTSEISPTQLVRSITLNLNPKKTIAISKHTNEGGSEFRPGLRRAKQEQGSDEQVSPKRSKQMFGYPTPGVS
jgi:hypothetical protein